VQGCTLAQTTSDEARRLFDG